MFDHKQRKKNKRELVVESLSCSMISYVLFRFVNLNFMLAFGTRLRVNSHILVTRKMEHVGFFYKMIETFISPYTKYTQPSNQQITIRKAI